MKRMKRIKGNDNPMNRAFPRPQIALVLALLTASAVAANAAGTTATVGLPAVKPFVHPGILHNRAELDFIAAKIKAGEEPWTSAWDLLRTPPVSQLTSRPQPIANVVRGAYNNPDVGASDLERAAAAAYSHALQWSLTGEKPHAEKAIEILNAYARTLQTIGGHDARLLVGMAGIHFVNAAELIRRSDAPWPEPDRRRFEMLLRDLFYPTIRDFFPEANGNWDAAMIQTMLAMGVYLDDPEIFNRAANYYLTGTARRGLTVREGNDAIRNSNGAIFNYVNNFGECQESGRDQAHTQMGLGYLGCACEIAWKQGVDLYSAFDNRLALGFEYTAKYNLGHDVPYEPYRSAAGKNYYPALSPKSRGRFSPIYEKVYHHYHDRKGLEMPYTKQVIDRIRPEGLSLVHASWGTLMFANLPPSLGN
jgi:hypothetical protein